MGKRIAPRYVVGNVLGPDRGDNMWVSSGGHCISVAKEQLRKAYGTELWVPEDEDIRELTKASESKDGKYYDEKGDGGVAHVEGGTLFVHGSRRNLNAIRN